jgi:hypothetical protein
VVLPRRRRFAPRSILLPMNEWVNEWECCWNLIRGGTVSAIEDGDGRLTGNDALKFFAMSNLSKPELKQVDRRVLVFPPVRAEMRKSPAPSFFCFLHACIVVVARHDPFVRKHVMRPFSWRWSVFETFADPLFSVYRCYRNVSFGSFRFGRSLIRNVRGILGSTSSWPLCRYAHTIHRYSLPSSFWSLNKWISSTD